VMQARQVTLKGRALPVPQPFMALGTQHPSQRERTYPPPEAELDPFMLKLRVANPRHAEGQPLLRQATRSARPALAGVPSLRQR
ncbi:AAA family ATPase, partial [Pseudomonas aeruginosa]